MNDNDIIALLFERSENALDELEKKYGRQCRKTAYNITSDNGSAEECVSDAMLRVWNSIPPQRPGSLLAYLMRIVRNRAIDMYRSQKLKPSCRASELSDELGELISSESAENTYERSQVMKAVNDFLGALGREDRTLFVRRYFFGDSLTDAASRVRLKPNAAGVRLLRLREKLKAHLNERGIML